MIRPEYRLPIENADQDTEKTDVTPENLNRLREELIPADREDTVIDETKAEKTAIDSTLAQRIQEKDARALEEARLAIGSLSTAEEKLISETPNPWMKTEFGGSAENNRP